MPSSVAQRFFQHVEFTDTCWLWKGGTARGYGRFKSKGRLVSSHRWVYEFCVCPIPPGLTIDHLCRIIGCVNPDHLEPVTMRTNVLRGETITAACARATHCPRGHPYDLFNTYITPSTGDRLCRTCQHARYENA